jgi:hypothetical protein
VAGDYKHLIVRAHALTIVFRLSVTHQDLGGDYYDRLNPERTIRKIQQRLQKIGYTAMVSRIPEATIPHATQASRIDQ